MVQRIGGARRKTRQIMTKPLRRKGKISMTKMFTKYQEGDNVLIDVEPSIQHGMGFRRFFGRRGIVRGMQGKAYKVEIKDGGKKKIILTPSIHLRRA